MAPRPPSPDDSDHSPLSVDHLLCPRSQRTTSSPPAPSGRESAVGMRINHLPRFQRSHPTSPLPPDHLISPRSQRTRVRGRASG